MLHEIKIGMSPYLIDSGGFQLTWHGFFSFVGVAVAVLVIAWLARRQKIKDDYVYNIALWAIIGGIIGARLVHVVDNWDFYTNNPGEILKVWNGGIGLWGGLLGGTLAGLASAYLMSTDDKPYPIRQLLHLAPIGLLVGQAIGRIGDIINGEHYSDITNLPWGVVYTHPKNPSVLAGIEAPQHPVVAYELLFDLAFAYVLFRLLGRLKPNGIMFPVYIGGYALWRFAIQFLRTDDVKFAGLQEAHIIALIVLAVAVPIVAYKAKWVARPAVQTPNPPSAAPQSKKG
ncbi:MAG: prolipoprotein diacylglyceryl transferase [Chloroflexi bacterium]|nr:prolipoprotein diacylglyceryl transferase [Chloroflexota bacterium]